MWHQLLWPDCQKRLSLVVGSSWCDTLANKHYLIRAVFILPEFGLWTSGNGPLVTLVEHRRIPSVSAVRRSIVLVPTDEGRAKKERTKHSCLNVAYTVDKLRSHATLAVLFMLRNGSLVQFGRENKQICHLGSSVVNAKRLNETRESI